MLCPARVRHVYYKCQCCAILYRLGACRRWAADAAKEYRRGSSQACRRKRREARGRRHCHLVVPHRPPESTERPRPAWSCRPRSRARRDPPMSVANRSTRISRRLRESPVTSGCKKSRDDSKCYHRLPRLRLSPPLSGSI